MPETGEFGLDGLMLMCAEGAARLRPRKSLPAREECGAGETIKFSLLTGACPAPLPSPQPHPEPPSEPLA